MLPFNHITGIDEVACHFIFGRIDFIDGIFQFQKESVVNIFLFIILRIELPFEESQSGFTERSVSVSVSDDRHEVNPIDAEHRVDVHFLCIFGRAIFSVGNVLQRLGIERCPDAAHFIIVHCVASTIVSGVPASHQLLGERIMVVTVDLYHAQVSVCLQLGSGELCIRVDGSSLGRVSVHVFHVFIATRSEKQGACHQDDCDVFRLSHDISF